MPIHLLQLKQIPESSLKLDQSLQEKYDQVFSPGRALF
jgi:hypothetical protein